MLMRVQSSFGEHLYTKNSCCLGTYKLKNKDTLGLIHHQFINLYPILLKKKKTLIIFNCFKDIRKILKNSVKKDNEIYIYYKYTVLKD